MEDILKYIKDGISIDGSEETGYTIFTIPTQHLKISSLLELIPSKFEEMIKKQQSYNTASYKLFMITDDFN